MRYLLAVTTTAQPQGPLQPQRAPITADEADRARKVIIDALLEDPLRSGAGEHLAQRDIVTLAHLAAGDLRQLRGQVERLRAKLETLRRWDPDAAP